MTGSSGKAASAGRFVLIDALRGLCIVFMTVDHLGVSPLSRLSNATYGPFGLFTAALGFIFLSGLTAGLVYEQHFVAYGLRSMSRRVARRVRQLYMAQLFLLTVLLVAVVSNFHGVTNWNLEMLGSDPWKGALLGPAMLYEPQYLGILPMYCLFLLFTPVLLWQFRKGRVWWVLGLSTIGWLASILAIKLPENPDGIDFGGFNPLSYQFLFLVGLAFGAKEISIERLSAPIRQRLIIAAVLVAFACFTVRAVYAIYGPFGATFAHLTSVIHLGPLRLLDFAAFAFIVYVAAAKVDWDELRATPWRWITFVGRHALPVFVWSILVTYGAMALEPKHPGVPLGGVIAILAVASLTIPAQFRATYMTYRKPRPPDRSASKGRLQTSWRRSTAAFMRQS